MIDWVFDRSRLAFVSGMKNLIVLPVPYLNLNRLYSHLKRDSVTMYRTIDLNHIIFENENKTLRTFDIVTGKQTSCSEVNFDLSGYTLFSARGYNTTIFKSEKDYSDIAKFDDFYDIWQLQGYVKNQKSFRSAVTGKVPINMFREVEIKGSHIISIALEFLYPNLENLNLSSNKKKDLVITKDDYKAQLYRCIPEPGKEPYQVKLQIIRVINTYPTDLTEFYKFREDCFSPDFSKFICLNYSDYVFEIRDTFTENLITTIPERFLNPYDLEEDDSLQVFINRTQWLDENILRVCSKEGLEVLFEVGEKMVPFSFN